MLFRMLRPNLMSYGHLVILVSANGRQDDEDYIGQIFHTLTQQWDLISHPRRNHRVSFVVMVLDNEQNPYLLFGFSDHQFSFYSICHQKVDQATYFKVDGLAQVLNWEKRSNLGGVEVVYSFSQGILVVVNLVESHVSHIDMHALLGDDYRADDVEAHLLAANGKLHLVWSPEHLQPDLGCLIVWSSFRIIGGVPEFSVVDFGQVTFMVNDPARLTAVEFAVL
ncbi:hypothetical protein AQUCO_03000263v1 [Aquilegia coerulea]|uniref:Uncharacterized protein n=1 Tax=Aquilegia coerulea TaxID=218851 RepID=A0A2G5D240_AQUCA|nr:hypothetical protein AQUCO_03000263v1 [Aquilegia coerulea]